MRYFTFIFSLISLASCFRFNGRITIQNSGAANLIIKTNPIISSETGGWENGINYFNRDSIIWKYSLGNNIHAKIIQPNSWKNDDSTLAQFQSTDAHFSDYAKYRWDTSQNGIYAMYPNSSFTIGEFNTKKKIIPLQDNPNGHFSIRRLYIFFQHDTLVANGDREIWNLLLSLDKNKNNYTKEGHRKKMRHWNISITD